jgi:hypothetical protein
LEVVAPKIMFPNLIRFNPAASNPCLTAKKLRGAKGYHLPQKCALFIRLFLASSRVHTPEINIGKPESTE